ncbi:MFS transporter [Hamadaea tsunoensis]|uniref:MFS transporter n=1 Tax=Hamadaea tsunoensis TaxID=53368 RepID=UPI00041C5502|nr:MFS transporter [Hamadaea tsunoensis]
MSAFAPLRHAPFRWLLLGRIVDMIGNAVAPMALAFAVLDLTGSASDLGLVVAARSGTNVLFVLVGGVIADRLPRRVVMIASAVLAAATQGAIAVLLFSGHASIGALAAIGTVNGMVAAFALPASAALAGQVVPDEIRQQSNALQRLATSFVTIGGTALGGVLIAAVGSAWGIAIDAASFAVAGLLFALIRVSEQSDRARQGAKILHDLRDGWRVFVSRTWLWVVVVGFSVLNMLLVGGIYVLGPAIADETFGRTGWGLLLSAQTAGFVLGGLLALRLRVRRFLLLGVIGMLGEAPLLVMLGVDPALPILVGLAFLGGIGVEIFSVAWETSMQRHVPADALARAYSWDILGSIIAVPVGQIVAGPAALAFGTRTALVAAGVVSLIVVVAMAVTPAVRTLDNTPAATTEEPELAHSV